MVTGNRRRNRKYAGVAKAGVGEDEKAARAALTGATDAHFHPSSEPHRLPVAPRVACRQVSALELVRHLPAPELCLEAAAHAQLVPAAGELLVRLRREAWLNEQDLPAGLLLRR